MPKKKSVNKRIVLPQNDKALEIPCSYQLVTVKHIVKPHSASKVGSRLDASQTFIIQDEYLSTDLLRFLLWLHPIPVILTGKNEFQVVGNYRLFSIVKLRLKTGEIKPSEKVPVLCLKTSNPDIIRSFTLLAPFAAALLYSFGKKAHLNIGKLLKAIKDPNIKACFTQPTDSKTVAGSNNYYAELFGVNESTLCFYQEQYPDNNQIETNETPDIDADLDPDRLDSKFTESKEQTK